MGDLISLTSDTDRNIVGSNTTPMLTLENTSTGGALKLKTSVSSATIAPLIVMASAASGAFFNFQGAVISTASLGVTGANVAALVRVWFNGSGGSGSGWMPIYLDAIAK